jgi:hypothetical protein
MRIRRLYVPRYSLTAHIAGVVAVCIVAVVCVAVGLHRAPLQESLVATTVLCAVMMAYFTIILYRGFRFDHGRISWKVPKVDAADVGDALSNFQGPDLGSGFSPVGDSAEGCLALIVGLVVGVVAFVVITILLSYGIEVGMLIVLLVAVPLYGIFRLSARMVIVHTRRCRGRLLMSLAIALPYAVLYTVAMGVVFYGIERMLTHARAT